MGAGALEWVPWVAAPMFFVCVVLATVMHRRKSNRDASLEEMSTETVQFPTYTRVVLIALAVVFGGIAVWLCFASSPWAALPLVLAIALTLRVQMLAVVFGEEELIISGFFGHRHVPRSRVLRLEGGARLYLKAHGREKMYLIPLTFSVSSLEEHSPNGQLKREVQRAFDAWRDEQ
ncbi:hypothetical protein DEI99_000990 [Curtobacterium sp. MCLR17_036]|uniref:hypothetical protein n=1 Tax=Curtobacterium sp. MCLR17_036 TaxID=2175620 RepID=UPI0011B56080|nr:hypothetical protein [Curtobacterium sp. MCLR17_036]WIE65133.1 hypothetical protein DEI99_000990 [Curtobacterium sp. MCLR17_036]